MQDNFIIKFNNGFLKGRKLLDNQIKKINFKIFIRNLFGIYDIFDSKIVSGPKQIGNAEWEYRIKILRIRKYFLWINYANRAWDNT